MSHPTPLKTMLSTLGLALGILTSAGIVAGWVNSAYLTYLDEHFITKDEFNKRLDKIEGKIDSLLENKNGR